MPDPSHPKRCIGGQDAIFLGSEGDRWFSRNRDAINNPENRNADVVLRMLRLHPEVRPGHVLEIGCANGWRLGELHARYGCACSGVEPSLAAIEEGRRLFPFIAFRRGIASALPFGDGAFDLVVIHLVFHWIARGTLLQSVAEADRVLADGGFLVIGDFLPDVPAKRRYHHLPGENVYTYKQDYAQMFLSSRLYALVDRMPFHHDIRVRDDDIPPDSRSSCALLQKSAGGFYAES